MAHPLTDRSGSRTESSQNGPASGISPEPGHASAAFVGRVRELALLRARLEAARTGEGGVALIVGEPGIGKTRLAQILAAEAQAAGAVVYWGRTYEGDWAPAYGPWIDVLGDYLRDLSPERLRQDLDRLGPGASSLARILPAIRGLVADSPPATLEPDEERFRLYDAVAGLLGRVAESRPLLVILDDLHWADRGSLGLLRYLLRVVPRTRLTIVATMREAELDQGDRRGPLTELLAAMHREPTFVRLPLTGLTEAEVDTFVQSSVNRTVNPSLGRAVHGETGGNPFYVQEVIRHLLDEGGLVEQEGAWTAAGSFRELGVPEGVRQVVNRRLARLSEPTHTLLSFASVFSGGADVRVLQRLTGLDEGALLDALDEALAAGLIRPSYGKAESYEFAHAIIRSALYEERSPSRNVRLHRQVAEALEAVYGAQPTLARTHAAELAAQYHASASLPGAERGIPHARIAAESARAGFDRDGAVRFLRMARDLAVTADADTRSTILARLAVAEAEALELDDAVRTTDEALASFAVSGSPPSDVAAFLQEVASALKSGGADASIWRPLVDRGLSICGETHDLTWARLSLIHDPIEKIPDTSLRAGIWRGFNPAAVDVARSLGNEDDYARTIESFDHRTPTETRALVRLGLTWRQPTAVLRALTVAANDLQYRHGAFADAIDTWKEQQAISERSGAVSWQSNALFNLSLLYLAMGDFDRSDAARQEAVALMSRLGPYRESDVLAMEMRTCAAWFRGGDWPALATYWSDLVTHTSPEHAAGDAIDFGLLAGAFYAATAALAWARVGDHAASGRSRHMIGLLMPTLEGMIADASNQNQNGAIALAGEAAWELELIEFAAPIRRLGQALLDAGIGDYPQTSLELTKARMSALLGDVKQATESFERARSVLEASGQRPVRAIIDLDEALFQFRMKGGDKARASGLLNAAQEAFEGLRMEPWVERAGSAQRMFGAQGGRPLLPAGLTEREVDVLRLVGRGYSDRQISEDLFISTRTVNAHLRNMFAKANVGNRTELSVWASAHGLLDQGDGEERN